MEVIVEKQEKQVDPDWKEIFSPPPEGFEVVDWQWWETTCDGEGWILARSLDGKEWITNSINCCQGSQGWSKPTNKRPEIE